VEGGWREGPLGKEEAWGREEPSRSKSKSRKQDLDLLRSKKAGPA